MKRTIEMRGETAFYGNREIGYIVQDLRHHFGLVAWFRYRITITKGSEYRIKQHSDAGYYKIVQNNRDRGRVCSSAFERLFFKPDGRKRYDIKVKLRR